jgi:DNA processing protein
MAWRLSQCGTGAAPDVNHAMTTGHALPDQARWALALSFLRFGADTRTARGLKALSPAAVPAPELPERLCEWLGIAPVEWPSRWADARARAASTLELAGRTPLTAMTCFDPAYPRLLWEIVDPPIVLWHRGAIGCLDAPAVAIVGSRRASPVGLMVARELARGVVEAGLVVVSGLARGVDAAAHEGALEAGGQTVAVLGCGGDVVYPAEHRGLLDRVIGSGAVVTEFPPGTPPLQHHFPLRNRIISGLCRAVVVVEASQRSGSLITARMALEQGRDVLAVPGNVASGQYSGSHALIKDGAPLVETVRDVLSAIGVDPAGWRRENVGRACEMSRLEAVMALGEPYSVDELAARSGLDAAALLAELGSLELAGRIGRVPGAGFVKVDKSAIGERNG